MTTPGGTLDIAILGLSITSAWGNGHATTYRALVRALAERGHRVRFFERNLSWYADHRDQPHPPGCRVHLYSGIRDLERRFGGRLRADVIILGSYVPEGARLAEWIFARTSGATAFYDIDTPVTLGRLERGDCEYLSPALIPEFDLYLSFAGGPAITRLRRQYGARRVRPLYCSVDPTAYYPCRTNTRYDLGYLGTYSADRQPTLEALLVEPARRWQAGRFCVAGAQYPAAIAWPGNVERIPHIPPDRHREFYNAQRLTLNVTRADMIANGYSPSVRLFEAAACGVPIVTDAWAGLEDFFTPGREILTADCPGEVLRLLREIDPAQLRAIADRARKRVLNAHTARHRAMELEQYVREIPEVSEVPRHHGWRGAPTWHPPITT